MSTTPAPFALLMPGPFPVVAHPCVHDYITVRCPACNATYVLALPRIAKFAGTVHANVNLLKSHWGSCGYHLSEVTIAES
jgi:hypothetical protein